MSRERAVLLGGYGLILLGVILGVGEKLDGMKFLGIFLMAVGGGMAARVLSIRERRYK